MRRRHLETGHTTDVGKEIEGQQSKMKVVLLVANVVKMKSRKWDIYSFNIAIAIRSFRREI
jgi:hypothetical protein